MAGSLCIDAGTQTSTLDHDFEGDPRPWNGGVSFQVDIGADEYYAVPTPLILGIGMANRVAALQVSGPVNANVTLQFATNLANPNIWMPLSNFILPASPYIVTDFGASNSPRRIYRAYRAQ